MTRAALQPPPAEIAESPPATGLPAGAASEPSARRDTGTRSRALAQYWTVTGSHVIVDIYPAFFASLAIALRHDLSLTDWQVATIYASNQILSGLPQSLAAWLSDRHDTRIAGPLGLVASCVCSCLIGFAPNFWVLWGLLSVAMIGNGIYHPIAGAQAGHLGGRVLGYGRAHAVSLFFAAGMVGSVIGPLACTRINAGPGLKYLLVLMPLGLAGALVLRLVTRHAPHGDRGHVVSAVFPPDERRARWGAVWLLYAGNATRFIVNTAMFMLFNIAAARMIPDDPRAATVLNGNLVVAMTVGMGLGAIFAGKMVRPGHERGAILLLSVLGGVFTAMTNWAGHAAGMWAMYLCAALTSLGFASILPLTIGLAQRLLPHRTSLASSLMMGGSWGVAAVTPILVRLFLGAPLRDAGTLPAWRIDLVFALFGVLLVLAGLVAMAMPAWLIRRVGAGDTAHRAEVPDPGPKH